MVSWDRIDHTKTSGEYRCGQDMNGGTRAGLATYSFIISIFAVPNTAHMLYILPPRIHSEEEKKRKTKQDRIHKESRS